MAFKYVILAAVLAVANAGIASYGIAAPAYAGYAGYAASPYAAVHAPAVASAQTNTYRGLGGQSSVTTYNKALDSAFSSVRKSDIRVTNDALAYAPAAYHAAPVAAYHAAPVAAYHAAPVAVAARAPISVSQHGGLLGVAYSPATAVSHMSYDASGIHYAY